MVWWGHGLFPPSEQELAIFPPFLRKHNLRKFVLLGGGMRFNIHYNYFRDIFWHFGLNLCRKYSIHMWWRHPWYYSLTLVTFLMNWPPVFHLQWLGHVPHDRHHLPTDIVWNSQMRELIGSVTVSSLLLPAFGTLSLLRHFRLPTTFLPSRERSITTLGTRWHDFY